MLLKYWNFVLESKEKEKKEKPKVYFILLPSFISVLEEIGLDDPVVSKLKEWTKTNHLSEISYINVGSENDDVTFLTTSNIKRLIQKDIVSPDIHRGYGLPLFQENKYRESKKIGRLIKQLFGDEISNKELEVFVNKYKSILSHRKDGFELVSGEDIRKWYLEDNYKQDGGPLNNSCMRYEFCQEYLDIYCSNPEVVSMLILKDEDDPTIIVGRALIWKLLEPKERILMDRIYYTKDHIIDSFKIYAKENNWIYKSSQSAHSNDFNVDGKNEHNITIKVQIMGGKYDYYPYVDTLYYYYPEKGILSNSGSLGSYIELNDTEGGPSDEDYVTDYNGDRIREDDAIWCEHGDEYCHTDDAVYLEYYSEYATPDIEVVWSNYHDSYLLEDDAKYIDYKNDYVHVDECTYSDHDNKYYLDSDVIYSEYYLSDILEDNSVEYVDSDGNTDYAYQDDLVFSKYHNNHILKDLSIELDGDYIYPEDKESKEDE